MNKTLITTASTLSFLFLFLGIHDLEHVIVFPFVGSKDEIDLKEIPNRFNILPTLKQLYARTFLQEFKM